MPKEGNILVQVSYF